MTDLPRVSCIVPAYNEAARIGAVLGVLCGHPLLGSVIVVDDGSSDSTAEVARHAGATVITCAQNGGKTAALACGIAAATGDVLLLIDADLIGLSAEDVTRLLAPVLAGSADAAISLRGNAPLAWRMIGLDYISGERAFARNVLDGADDTLRQLPRFGFEVYLNSMLLARGARLAVVDWPGVASPSKQRKRGLLKGVRADLRMMADILGVISPATMVRQILGLRARRVLVPAPACPARSVAPFGRKKPQRIRS